MDTENLIIDCQYCKQQTPSEFNFCSKCYAQIKCIECGTKTLLDVEICLGCGKPLVSKNQFSKSNNIYTRHVKKEGDNYEEDIRFELTDDSVGKIAPFIVGQTMGNYKSKSTSALKGIDEKTGDDIEDYQDISQDDLQSDYPNNEIEKKHSDDIKSSPIRNFFKNDNGIIVAVETDFRGKNWSEQQKNFIIIFTKAYQEILKSPIPSKDIIRVAAKKLNIIDIRNFPSFLTKASAEFMTELSNGFELNAKGIKEAQRIIDLMVNENTPPGFVYSSRANTSSTKRLRISAEDKNMVNSWIKDSIDLGKLDIRDVKSGRDAALLALWIITVKLEKVKACYIHVFMEYLNKKFTTISVSAGAVSKALTVSKDADKYFQKTSDSKYFLSTTGQKLVEDWISGAILLKSKDIN